MAALKAVKHDPVGYEPVMLALGKARALTSVLTQLGEDRPYANNLVAALRDGSHPEDTLEWLHMVVAEALRNELDTIEREYRKVGTNGRMVLPAGVQSNEGGA